MDQIYPKSVFLVKKKKVKITTIEFCIFELVYVPNFTFKQTVLSFGTKSAQKWYFLSNLEKVNITIEFYIFKLVYAPNCSLNWQFWFFWSKKDISSRKWKSDSRNWIVYIWIDVGTKFQLKLIILLFLAKLAQKEYFWSKQKKCTLPLDSSYLNYFRYQILLLNKQFWSLGQICSKRVHLMQFRKSEHNHWVMHIQISLGIKYHLKMAILILWTEKGISGQKWKSKRDHLILHIRIKLGAKFHFKQTIWTLGPNLCKKDIFVWKQKK